jgi:hypothetical protein
MPIAITCAGCGKNLKVKDEWAGKKGKCPQCGTTFLIPAAGEASKKAWGGASAAVAEKKAREKKGAPITISPMLIVGALLIGSLVLGVVLFLSGPKKVWGQWEEISGDANNAVESVISRGLQSYESHHGWDPGKSHSTPGVQGDILFYRPSFVMSMPEAVDFQGVSSDGEFHGKYHPKTGEVEATCALGPNQFKRGVGEAKNSAPTIKITGRIKNGNVTAEVDGKNADIVYPKHADE